MTAPPRGRSFPFARFFSKGRGAQHAREVVASPTGNSSVNSILGRNQGAPIDSLRILRRRHLPSPLRTATAKRPNCFQGLVVPVLRGDDKFNFAEIEKNINTLAMRATEGTISIDEMVGGTFTISNGGIYGSLLSIPIINPPQSAILGMHSIVSRPMVFDGVVVPRPMMYIALTYDHRLIDRREAVYFLRRIKVVVEDPRRLLLDL